MNDGSDFHDTMGRIGPLAVVDIVGTIVIAAIYAYYMEINVFLSIALFLIAGEIVHFILDVETPVTKFIINIFSWYTI